VLLCCTAVTFAAWLLCVDAAGVLLLLLPLLLPAGASGAVCQGEEVIVLAEPACVRSTYYVGMHGTSGVAARNGRAWCWLQR
jgi:hypothetical protein